jgi:N-acetylglucosamine-6-sulfatase
LRQLAAVDDGVGDMLKTLKRLGQLDSTFLCLMTDHGFFYGEHCLSQERRLAYEESIHVSLFMRYPRLIHVGQRETRFALGIDLAPTMLEIAGAQVPAWMHGRSLVPVLKNHVRDWRKSFLIEYFSDKNFPRVSHMGYQAIRSETWKYIHYMELENMDELYDLNADPYEMRNLIDDPGASQSKEAVRTEIKRLLTDTGGHFVV